MILHGPASQDDPESATTAVVAGMLARAATKSGGDGHQ